MSRSTFEWALDSSPQKIFAHSAAKHKLIKNYLDRYFDTVVPTPKMERLQISLIDGFCGGGAFMNSSGETVPGTPMIMLQAVKDAEERLNRDKHKKLEIDARYYFIDKSKAAIDYLQQEIKKTEFASQIDNKIHLLHGEFQDEYENIIKDIRKKSSAGRSIFLLDQFGYREVPLLICQRILSTLRRSEIILTFAIDWLIDPMSLSPAFLNGVSSLGISEGQIKEILATKNHRKNRYFIQRILARHLQYKTETPYFTPFFLRSEKAHRNLWLLHLSQHPTARNVMVSSHWDIQNSSIYQGKGGLNMLGFDPGWEGTLPLDFKFDGNAEAQTMEALRQDIPYRIEALGPITFDAFFREIANDTSAKFDHILRAIMDGYKEKDLEIWTPSGRRKKPDTQLKSTDYIQLSQQLPIFKFPK